VGAFVFQKATQQQKMVEELLTGKKNTLVCFNISQALKIID